MIENFVFCSVCKKIFCYSSRDGTTRIVRHKKEHEENSNDNANNNSIRSHFVRTNKRIFSENDKNDVKKAATEFVVRDTRPFHALKGDGLIQLLVMFSVIGAKYGKLSDEEVIDILPSPTTVNIFLLK